MRFPTDSVFSVAVFISLLTFTISDDANEAIPEFQGVPPSLESNAADNDTDPSGVVSPADDRTLDEL